ncbi:CRISPR system precrRNA processing endoribonuclease RAMP protein Cas6 [Chitinivibrio alkaliphilus]|nr:CRISPR system precrRNA processing endoribonuclease RAMP protein Cas6 [Chitinivibrio alkaliphilus]
MLTYSKVEFTLRFSQPVFFKTYPTFLFRSVIGNALKKISCAMKDGTCESCLLKNNCAYAWFFETHVAQDNDVLPGVKKASHPFILSAEDVFREKTDTVRLTVTLIGKGREYINYLLFALIQAGERGLFRDRISFTVRAVQDALTKRQVWEGDALSPPEKSTLSLNPDTRSSEKRSLCLRLHSPVKIQKGGRVIEDIDYMSLLQSIHRRVRILAGFFGDRHALAPVLDFPDLSSGFLPKKEHFTSRRVYLPRWSGRQKRAMDMGGMEGAMDVSGLFSPCEMSLLSIGEVLHVGKNTGFGLGRYTVEKQL